MSKQSLKHKNNVRIAHQSKNRVRIICENITDTSDVSAIEATITERTSAKSVRVNKYAKSVIVEFDSGLDKTSEFISNFDMPKKAKDTSQPSKVNIYKAGAALAVTPFITNTKAKTAIGLYSAAPNLIEGAKELKNEGVTSKVLEAMAIGTWL